MTNRFSELTQDIQDRIREIAYLMWESAGRQHGMAMEYWLSAEQEVLSTLQAAAHRMLPDAEAKTKPIEKSAPAKAARPAAETSAAAAPALAAPAPALAAPATAPAAPATASGAAKAVARRTTRTKAKV